MVTTTPLGAAATPSHSLGRRLVVAIHYGHPNDLESAPYAAAAFRHFGYEQVDLATTDPQLAPKLQALLQQRGHEIFCFFSFNYHAATIRANDRLLDASTGIPIVIMLFDHPAYFMDQQQPALAGQIVFAPGDDAADFVRRYYQPGSVAVTNFGSHPPFDDGEPAFEDFAARTNAILCPMSLTAFTLNMDQTWQRIRELPEPRRARARALAEAAVTDVATPLHALAERIRGEGPAPVERAEVADQKLVLNFVKLWRRTRMIRDLIDLPILVSTDVPPADLDLKYPHKFVRLSMKETIPLYRRYRFALNSSPLLATLHDRVLNAWYSNAACITDRNPLLDRLVRDGRDVLFYDYDSPGQAQRIAGYIDDPQKAFALTAGAFDVRKRSQLHLECYRNLIDAVERRWAQGAQA